jgi:hypothetical protein
VPPTLARTLRSTNTIESMIEICRDHAANVKRWRDGQMVLRWTAAGMSEARLQFRRVNGYLHLPACGRRWMRPSPLSHRPRRMPPPDHPPGPPPKFHSERDILDLRVLPWERVRNGVCVLRLFMHPELVVLSVHVPPDSAAQG